MNVGRALSQTAVALGCCLLAAYPAAGQTALGASVSASANVLNHVSYDDKHHVYLQAYELSSNVYGRFIGANGTVLGTSFLISTVVGSNGYNWAGGPKVAYSRGGSADVFMVVYLGSGGPNILLSQLVQYTGQGATGGQLVGGSFSITKYQSTNQKVDDLVFNPVTGQFLAVWEELLGNGYEVIARPYGTDGTAIGSGAINVSNATGSQGLSQVAYDWNRNQFMVAWQGEAFNNGPLGIFGKVLDGNGQPITQAISIFSGAAFEPACLYLPERDGFLVAYTAFKPDRFVAARFVPSSYGGSLPDANFTALDTAGNDGYATGDYDWVSRRVFLGAMSDTSGRFVRGTVLDGNGAPVVAAFVANSVPSAPNGAGLFYPTIRAAEDGKFGFSYDVDYGQAAFERYQFTAANTPGPHFGGAPPPPPPAGTVLVQIDQPAANSIIQPPFAVAGWAIDTHSQQNNGVDFLHVWAWPTNGGSPVFVGVLDCNLDRPDVGNAYGANFKKSGFGVLMSNLPPGSYTLVAYPHSSFTGAFDYDHVVTRSISVVGSVLTQVDTPTWAQVFGNGGNGLTISGYAIDLSQPTGTGVDAVDIWATNAVTGVPTFLGHGALNQFHAGAAAFGQRFANGGYSVTTSGLALPPGLYYVLVFSKSIGNANFNIARVVGIFIQ